MSAAGTRLGKGNRPGRETLGILARLLSMTARAEADQAGQDSSTHQHAHGMAGFGGRLQ